MEEEQHHHHYGGGAGSSCNTPAMADLRQFFSPIPTHNHQFPPPPPSLYSPAAAAAFPHHYDTMMLVMGAAGPGVHDFRPDNSAGCAAATAAMVPASSSAGFDMENAAGAGGGFGLGVGGLDGGATARWPRQETLTLLEIRSRLDHKFKEANHKGPLWDEVSRIMCEEHGYQRSGKKCREKFENLYKYYKKTKEGKAGRQDGKHYRFFRQLEALYGEQPPPNPPSAHLNLISNYTPTATPAVKSTSLSNTSSDLDTSSSEGGAGSMDGDSDMVGRRSRKRRGWKARIKEFIDAQMRRIVEKQEAWLERMMRSLEHREEERVAREEEWRRQEAARMEREHRFWAKERAWIEARDKALMEALHRITGNEEGGSRWGESEMVKLVELRASVQERFDECGGGPGEGGLWDEVSTRMTCLGHDRSARMCKDKWDFISKELSEKGKEADCNTKSHQYHHLQTTNLLYNYGPQDMNGQGGVGLGPPQIGLGGGGNPMNDSCLRILLGDGGGGGETNPWDSYGVKLTKGDQTH